MDRQSWANPHCASCLPLGEGFAQPPRRAATRGPPHSGGKPAGHRSPPYIHPDSNISLRTFVCRDIIIAVFRRIRNRLSFAVGRVACARLLPQAKSHRRALTQPALRPLNECAGAHTPRRGRRPRRPGGMHPTDCHSQANPHRASCLPLGEGFAQHPS